MSLIETILKLVPPGILGDAASRLGEENSVVTKAIGAVVPMLLGGMIQKSSSDTGLQGLFSMLSDPKAAGFLDNLGGLVGSGNLAHGDPKDAAGALIGSLFGDKTGPLLGAVSSFAGFKSKESAGGLLALAGPLVMGFLSKKITGDGLGAAGLKSLLAGERDNVAKVLPAPLAALMGFAAPAVAAGHAHAAAPAPAAREEEDKGVMGWLVPLLMAAAVAGIIWFVLDSSRKPAPAPVAALPAAVTPPPVEETPAPVVAAPVIALADVLPGVDLSGLPNGVETRLVDFINSGREPCTDPECWFTMDRLTFESGSATIDVARSSEQLDNLLMILEAFPNIQLKFGGYTDNTGTEDANLALSQARAESVIAALVAAGIAPPRLVAEGYGSQFPVASNDTEEGRAANRRIDVRVRER